MGQLWHSRRRGELQHAQKDMMGATTNITRKKGSRRAFASIVPGIAQRPFISPDWSRSRRPGQHARAGGTDHAKLT